ncbi:hypothetical protein D3C83_04010 [compost metagenome]
METRAGRSATFRRLCTELGHRDVVVQVLTGRTQHRARASLLHRITVAGDVRYLFVVIDPNGAARRVIATLAHELQHAIEVARETEVGRSIPVDRFFMQIANVRCGEANCFETSAAIRVQHEVLRELD